MVTADRLGRPASTLPSSSGTEPMPDPAGTWQLTRSDACPAGPTCFGNAVPNAAAPARVGASAPDGRPPVGSPEREERERMRPRARANGSQRSDNPLITRAIAGP